MGVIYDTQLIRLLSKADIWEELPNDGYYLGYADRGTTTTASPTFAICYISPVDNGIQTKKWSNGAPHIFNVAWDDRATLTYKWEI